MSEVAYDCMTNVMGGTHHTLSKIVHLDTLDYGISVGELIDLFEEYDVPQRAKVKITYRRSAPWWKLSDTSYIAEVKLYWYEASWSRL